MATENSNSLKRPRPPDWQRPLPLRKQHVKRNNNNNNVPPVKRNYNVPLVEVVDDGHRRWEDMDHEILVSIMKRLDVRVLLLFTCLVSKSWLNATLDALFPPNHVFSFRDYPLLSSYHPFLRERSRLWTMIKLHLNRNLHCCYTKLILSHGKLKISAYRYIAERMPSITSLFVHMDSQKLLRFREFASCWKGLVELECSSVSCVQVMGLVLGNQIHTLSLYRAEVKVQKAISIVNYFPSLTHLSLEHCTLSNDALSVLLQPQKNLTYLDMRHACVNEKRDPKDWDEQLLSKATKIPQFLRCELGYCSFCFPSYRRLPPR